MILMRPFRKFLPQNGETSCWQQGSIEIRILD